jgi:Protein of unknown function (DUF4246)
LLQIIEMKMCAISNAIREKPRWWEKIKDPEIVAKWRKEVLESEHEGEVESREKVAGESNDDHGEEEEKAEGKAEGEEGEGEGENTEIFEELRKVTEQMVRAVCICTLPF